MQEESSMKQKKIKKRGKKEFGDFRKQSKLDSQHDEINGWRFQKDRTCIDDGFQQGDLECLFDESNVVDRIEIPSKR